MTPLQRWASEKNCCCRHPERYSCAEDMLRRTTSEYDRQKMAWNGEELEPCDCCCHEDFFEEEDDER